jgi:predicted ATPase
MTAQVFVSYARRDREKVAPWVQRLRCAGVSVWMDEASIEGAQIWRAEIVEAIEGCQVLLVMLSSSSVESDTVIREVTVGADAKRQILPLLLEPVAVPSALRLQLAGIQHLELFERDEVQMFRTISRSLARLGVTVREPDTPPSPAVTPTNLPRQLTSFVGRERDVEAVPKLLLREGVCLVTLTGPGGAGKTRLALQVAGDLIDAFPDGVFFVALASIGDPELILYAIAQTLGLPESGDRSPSESLKAYLSDKQMLILLDNFEHVLEAAPQVAELLATCPRLKVLVTSRAVLHLRGEKEFPVRPLALPDPKRLPPFETLSQYAAVALFIQRALDVKPEFAVTNANAPAVAEICARLDGLPLAIELAAAWIKLFPPQALLGRLESRLKLLTGGARDLPPRQQTLRGTIAWSYDLLAKEEKALFRRLSVFAGGFTLDAAESVCSAAGEVDRSTSGTGADDRSGGAPAGAGDNRSSRPTDHSPDPLEIEVLDGIASLADKSLLQQVTREPGDAEPRFGMLEVIREYGLECLATSGEAPAIRRRHASYFLTLVEEAEPELRGPQRGVWLQRLEMEHDNLRAALAWAALVWSEEGGEAAAALRLGRALWEFWWVQGYLAEGREGLARLLALTGAPEYVAERAKALHRAGVLACDQGDYAAARALHEESLAVSSKLGDRRGIATSLNNLAHVARLQGDYPAAQELYGESLAIGRNLGDRRLIAFSLDGLGMMARYQGDYAAARGFYEESLALGRELGDRQSVAIVLNNLGWVAQDQGDYAAARAFYEESLLLKRGLGDRRGVAFSLNGLGLVALCQGDHEPARALFEESLAIRRELGDRRGTAFSLNGLGTVARYQGDAEAARRFHEESLAIRQELGEKPGIAYSLQGLAEVSEQQGDYDAAQALYLESLALRQELGARDGIVLCLEGLARVACGRNQPGQAARLFGAAEALREAVGVRRHPADRTEYERHVAAARAALGEEAFGTAWTVGRAMPQEEAVSSAIAAVAT